MQTIGSLGEFLQVFRARLQPEDVGYPSPGHRRRVQGLRREEIAQVAGVSVSYYTRLEQGLSVNASHEVLDAIARALLLDPHEREHLHSLAAAAKPSRRPLPPYPEQLTSSARDLLACFDLTPAFIVGRYHDVLGWNRQAHALLAAHVDFESPECPAARPNTARLIFLDPGFRTLFVDWRTKAKALVGNLRSVAGRYPDDPALAALVGELSAKSPDFVELWSEYYVRPCEVMTLNLRHQVVGTLTVTQQVLKIASDRDQSLVAFTAPQGSASAAALELLAHTHGWSGSGSRVRKDVAAFVQ